MRDHITEAFTLFAKTRADVFRQPVFQLLNTALRAVNARLRVLLIQALRGALLALVGALYLRLKSETHPLTQAFQLRLLTGQPQLRMLLLQAVKKLGKATMAVGEEVVHRHFQTLLPDWSWRSSSCWLRLTISAAAEGVGARRSATKSAIVTSVSWPTALTME
jgi:hypothetical protein